MLRVLQLFSHLQSQVIPVASENNPIGIYATQDPAHQTVSLLFINKANLPQLAQVAPANQFLGVSQWSSLNVSLAPQSITVVTLHHGAGAEAYTFTPPEGTDTSVPPLIHTVCGHKTDPLAVGVPC